MPDYLQPIYTWLIANPHIWVPVAIYVAYNLIPRTPPTDRRLFALWAVAERFMVLGWRKWGGPWKALGIVSPDPEKWADEAVTKKVGKS